MAEAHEQQALIDPVAGAEALLARIDDDNGAERELLMRDGETGDVRLGDTVKRLREQAGWSIQRLAREAGVSSATIFKIEKDRMAPSVTVLLKLAKALKQPIATLLENQGPRQKSGYAVFKAKSVLGFEAKLSLVE